MKTEQIPNTVTKTALAAFFQVDRSTITGWQKKGMPCLEEGGHGGRNGMYSYNLQACLAWRYGPKSQDPDGMAPQDRKAWFESETKRRALVDRDRTLTEAADVDRTLRTMHQAITDEMSGWPAMLTVKHGISEDVAQEVRHALDEALDGLTERLGEVTDLEELMGNWCGS
jgi:phage terminase Nu1 subunit (DNA packaging protein)